MGMSELKRMFAHPSVVCMVSFFFSNYDLRVALGIAFVNPVCISYSLNGLQGVFIGVIADLSIATKL